MASNRRLVHGATFTPWPAYVGLCLRSFSFGAFFVCLSRFKPEEITALLNYFLKKDSLPVVLSNVTRLHPKISESTKKASWSVPIGSQEAFDALQEIYKKISPIQPDKLRRLLAIRGLYYEGLSDSDKKIIAEFSSRIRASLSSKPGYRYL